MSGITIQTHSLPTFRDRLAAVNKRLARHGLSGAVVTGCTAEFRAQAGRRAVEVDPQDDLASIRGEILRSVEGRVEDLVYAVRVEVPTELIQWKGHRVLGRIQREEGGDIVTHIGGHDQAVGQFRGKPFECAHCGTRRTRKSIWVFLREADGVLLTLGDDCAEEYFGVEIGGLLDEALAFTQGDGEEDEEWGFGGGNRPNAEHGFLLAAFGASLIAFEGYKSRKAHEDGATSVQASALAAWVLNKGWSEVTASLAGSWDKFTRAWWERTAPRWEEFRQTAQDARAWWNGQDPREDYLANCKTAAVSMNPRHEGLIVCAIWEYMKAHGLVGETSRDSFADGWLGAPKEKVQGLPVEMVGLRAFDSEFGPRYFVTFRDDEGHCLLWKASSNPDPKGDLKPGTRLLLSGTIKEHAVRKEVKQTILLRCKLAVDASTLEAPQA